MPRYPGYLSYESCGVDTKKFYADMGTTITNVSRDTGINRASLSAFPVDHVYRGTACKVILYLEEENIRRYRQTIQECSEEIQKMKNSIQEAWKIYLQREKLLNTYRVKYDVKRNCPLEQQISVRDVMKGQY